MLGNDERYRKHGKQCTGAGEPDLLAMDPGGMEVFTADLACFRAALIREGRW